MADEFVTDCKVKRCTKSLQTPQWQCKRSWAFSPEMHELEKSFSCLSLSFLICTMSCYLSKNEWMPAGFHFWVIGCILDDSWHSSHPALARKTRGPVLMKEAGVREHQRLKDAQRRVWALFPWRAGPAKPIRAPEQLWAEGGRWEWGDSNGSFPPSPPPACSV